MIVKYEPFTEIVLFGGTPLMPRLAKRLREHYRVTMYTAPRQVADVPEVEGTERIITSDINQELVPAATSALGIGLGEAWRFGPRLRTAFGQRLIDFMSIPYPEYLGGAHVTHAILRGERYWGASMQLVTENTIQGEVHDGPVIYGIPLSFPMEDEHYQLERRYYDFIVDFITKANDGYEFKPGVTTYRHGPKSFFPRLNTERQGWVDFDWRRIHVIRFIKGFDAPYPGARTLVHDGQQSRMVTLHDVIDVGVASYHPFQSGLILDEVDTIKGKRATVALRDGAIAVTIRDDLGHLPAWLKPGMRLHTDRGTLDHAMTYCPQYTASGDTAMKVMT